MSYFNDVVRWLLRRSSFVGLFSFILLCLVANGAMGQSRPPMPSNQGNHSDLPIDPSAEYRLEPNSDDAPGRLSASGDPLNSSYPVPWTWVQQMQETIGTPATPQVRYYRSDALVSPDGHYAAYSRIQLQVLPEPTQNRVSSILFLENLTTGEIQLITASSPLAAQQLLLTYESQPLGAIAILIPVSWSATGDRILAREFESLFGTDIGSDYAVIWDRQHNRIHTIAPEPVNYSNAVLLGWSETQPHQVLFQAGNLGDESWPTYAVEPGGQTVVVTDVQPVAFGRRVTQTWSGSQAYR